jgi:LysR family transcriptional regulator, mexEF-oprN operon transcriptional activator
MIQSKPSSRKSIEMIGTIRERDFRGVDLNLLVTLLVLLRERSVSKAAACLHLGQPAVSGALARLRELFHDELLVRGKGGMQPTQRGLELQSALAPALAELQAVVSDAPAFDPARSDRSFVIGMPDWIDTWLLPGLVARLAAEAPQARIAVVATDRFRIADMLLQEQLDLAIGAFPAGPAWQRSRPLATVPYCCVARPGVIGKKGTLTLKQFAALPHLMVTYRGAFHGTVDDALDALGLKRRIVCTSPRFSSLPRVLQQVPAIATVPQVLAPGWQRDFGLVRAAVPLKLPPSPVAIVHHASRDKDPALRWLCGLVEAVVADADLA